MPPSSWRATAGALFALEKTPVTSAHGVVAAKQTTRVSYPSMP
jgi:hypothetical protein